MQATTMLDDYYATVAEGWLVAVFYKGNQLRIQNPDESDGSFLFKGLQPHPLALAAWDLRTGGRAFADGVRPGGEPVVLRAMTPGTGASLRGRVIGAFGEPVGGARVSILGGVRLPVGNAAVSPVTTRTARDGRFELQDVPPQVASVSVGGSLVEGRVFQLEDRPWERLELQVDQVSVFLLDVAQLPAGAVDVRALDAQGQPLELRTSHREQNHGRSLPVEGSFQCFVSQRASTLIAVSEEGELGRIPVRLRAGFTNQLVPWN